MICNDLKGVILWGRVEAAPVGVNNITPSILYY